MKSANVTEPVKARKGAKTEAILRYLEKHGVVAPSVIAPAIKLCSKEVSSRLSMLVAQGRVKREEDEDGGVLVRFVSWEINHIEDDDPEPQQAWEVPELERCFQTAVHDRWLGEQLMAVANVAVTSPADSPQTHGATMAPSLLGLLDPSLVTPFTQVMLRAVSEGRVRVTTHCLADEEPPMRRRGALTANAATQAAAAAAMAAAAAASEPAPAAKPAPAAQVLDRVDDVTTFAFDVQPAPGVGTPRMPRAPRRARRPTNPDDRQVAQFAQFALF